MKSVQAVHCPWTEAEVLELRAAYATATTSDKLPLAAIAAKFGRNKANVCRKARSLGLTAQARPKKTQRKLDFFGPKYSPTVHREKLLERLRDMWKHQPHPRGYLGRVHPPAARAKMSAASRRAWENRTLEQTDAMMTKSVNTRIAKYGSGNSALRSENAYSRAKRGKRADLGGQFFRSAWEANYARYLNYLVGIGHIKHWSYEPNTFIFDKVTRGVRSYTPDFFVVEASGWESYHEVKGWITNRSIVTWRYFAKFYSQYNLKIIDAADYKVIDGFAAEVGIAHWERSK